jgi:hypothetical protein
VRAILSIARRHDITIAPITGTTGNDILRGIAQDDVVFGLDGADNLRGLGNDGIDGDRRANTFIGSGGHDRYRGKDGADTLHYSGTGIAAEIAQGGLYTKRDGAKAAGTIEVFGTVIGEASVRNKLNGAGPFASVVIDLGAGRIDATVEQALRGFPAGASFGFGAMTAMGRALPRPSPARVAAQDRHGAGRLMGGAGHGPRPMAPPGVAP